ncbi:putative sulfate exporter family transporter [Saccharopolyspora sp. NPDC047091]|uniref:YeiH family protein n=1 Tax=Saccharopolyspora sp. NPDC047091 TaxID=3155924 RepID=UPI0033E43022
MRTSVELRAVWVERLPGVVVAAVGVLVAQLVSAWVPGVGVVTAAVALGVLVGNLPGGTGAAGPGLAWVARSPLRAGVVLLGLQLAVGQVLGLGAATLGVVVAVVVVGVVGTVLIGRALGLPPGLSVLVAVGSSICGASAIAAVEGVVEREDEDVAAGVAMVTVFGTLLVVLVPLVGSACGWDAADVGRVAGGGVHEVAQVVAAASPAGAAAVSVAVVVKLSRVALLAPVVAVVGWVRRRGAGGSGVPLLPLFVVGFLVAMGVRATGWVPAPVLGVAAQVSSVLLAAALFALGTAVRVGGLRRAGPRALLLGACSTVLVVGTAATGMLLLT